MRQSERSSRHREDEAADDRSRSRGGYGGGRERDSRRSKDEDGKDDHRDYRKRDGVH